MSQEIIIKTTKPINTLGFCRTEDRLNPHGALTRESYPTYFSSVSSLGAFQTSFLGNSDRASRNINWKKNYKKTKQKKIFGMFP